MTIPPEYWGMFGIPYTGYEDKKPDAFYCESPADVSIFQSPWVAGTRSVAYRGPTTVTIEVDTIAEAFYIIDDCMKERAFYMGCNAVVGYERDLHVWEEPIICTATGTLAILALT